MRYSIGVKGLPEYGLENGKIVHDPKVRDLFDSMEDLLYHLDEYGGLLEKELQALGVQEMELCILKMA